MAKELYVTVARNWLSREKRWSTRYGVTEDQIGSWYWSGTDTVLAVFRVKATSRPEALGVVAEFMLRGMPASMTVDPIYVNPRI